MYKKTRQLINILKNKYKDFSAYARFEKDLKFIKGKTHGSPQNLEFDDTLWETVDLPFEWDPTEDVWFRKKLVIPEEVLGISVEGAAVEISGIGHTDLLYSMVKSAVVLPGEMYIDGSKVMEDKNFVDFRFRFTIAQKAKSGDVHIIAFRFFKRQDYHDFYPRSLSGFEIFYSSVDDILFEMESFIGEANFAQSLVGGKDILENSLEGIDLELVKDMKYCEIKNLIGSLRLKLSSLEKTAKENVVYLCGHAHIDLNYYWTLEETAEVCKNTFTNALNFMDKFPDFCFSQSQGYIYYIVEKNFPELFRRIKKGFNEGRWDITASTWVEPDLNMADGEAIIRQILYSKKYIKEKFGFEPRIFWSPDTFGHPWTIPQILKKSGINYYYFQRAGNKDNDVFWWEAPDGSKILAFNSLYFGQVNVNDLVELAKETIKNQKTNISMFVYGVGNHGGGPTIEDLRKTKKITEKPILPRVEFGTAHNYFDIISKKDIKIPTIKDELNPIFDGSYTTHSDIKAHNRNCERQMIESEKVGSIVRILTSKYPDLEEYWKVALLNQFHDTLGGSCAKPSYDYSNSQATMVEKSTGDIIYSCIQEISKKIKVKSNYGQPIMVFNSLSWPRTDIAEVDDPDNLYKYPLIKDGDGNIYDTQKLNKSIYFTAEDIPAFGYKIFYLSEDKSASNSLSGGLLKKDCTMENDFFILECDKDTGTISYLFDKKNKKTVMKKYRDEGLLATNAFPARLSIGDPLFYCTSPVMNNLLQVLYEEPHRFSSLVIGPIGKTINLIKNTDLEVISEGPVLGIIRMKKKFNKSSFIQDIVLYNGIDRIDFRTYIDWNEISQPGSLMPMLKAGFTPILNKITATYEIPFGSIERVADGREFPALKWIDISDEEYGVSLLSDTKYGFDVNGNTMKITLARTSNEPDPVPDKGEQSFIYSIYPHKGSSKEAETVKKGYELNYKLMTYKIDNSGCGILPDMKSFIDISPSNVILTCFKKMEDGQDLILRVYETKGLKTRSTIKFGFDIGKVVETNLIEKPIENKNIIYSKNKLKFKINPFEIKTYRITLRDILGKENING